MGALLLQRGKGMDLKSYADLLLIKLRRFSTYKGYLIKVLCALLLQRGKAMDLKSYANQNLIYL